MVERFAMRLMISCGFLGITAFRTLPEFSVLYHFCNQKYSFRGEQPERANLFRCPARWEGIFLSHKAKPLLDIVVEFFGVFVFAEFGEGFGFNLANTFTGHVKFLANFFQRVWSAVFKSKTELEDFLLALW